MTTDKLRVILFQEDGQWAAQCLEHDIAAQGADPDDVLDRLELTIEAELAMRGADDLRGISPAPVYYQQLWDKKSLKLQRVNVPVIREIPEFDVAFAKAA